MKTLISFNSFQNSCSSSVARLREVARLNLVARCGVLLTHNLIKNCMYVYVCVQLTRVILPSGKRFQLLYDNSSRLTSVVTPSHQRHEFQRLIMPGIDRLLYRPARLKDPYIVDYDPRGRLLSVIHPQRHRRVTYKYASNERDFDAFYDSSHVRHRTKLLADYTLQTSSVDDFDVNCSCVIERTENVTMTSVQVTLTGCTRHRRHDNDDVLLVGDFVYTRDSHCSETLLNAVVAGHKLPATKSRLDNKSRQTTYASPFSCQRHRHRREESQSHGRRCVSDDGCVEVTRHYDTLNRLSQIVMSFSSRVSFSLQVISLKTRAVFTPPTGGIHPL